MSRFPIWIACMGMAVALTAASPKPSAAADVSINLRIGDPYRGPRLAFRNEPQVVVVPGTRVYYVRDYDYDIYRYGGYWYYNYDGGWYRSRRYNGPFTFVGYRSVPRAVTYVPVRYRKHWREARDMRYERPAQRQTQRQDVRQDRRDQRQDDRRDKRNDNRGGRGRGN